LCFEEDLLDLGGSCFPKGSLRTKLKEEMNLKRRRADFVCIFGEIGFDLVNREGIVFGRKLCLDVGV